MTWLLEQSTLDRMNLAFESGAAAAMAAQHEPQAAAGGASKLLTVAGKKGVINITGVLTNEPDILAEWFGGGNTTYKQIREAVAAAENDDDVSEIVFEVDNSPGGSVAGLFEAMSDIAGTTKPTSTAVHNMAASATYALISQTDKITASNEGARFGSVGVVVDSFISKNLVSVTSTEAPDKRPDLATDEGKAVVQKGKGLDQIHSLMARKIGNGRGKTEAEVNAGFGRGSVMLAAQASKAGMIDKIKTTAAKSSGIKQEATNMDLKELKAKHSDVYDAAVQEGIDQERDRVNAHLKLGSQSGAMETALKAIEDGSGMTMTLQAEYMSAGMKNTEVTSRQEDNPDVKVDGSDEDPPTSEAEKFDDEVLAQLHEEFGDGPVYEAIKAQMKEAANG
jgi:ClpP class serine protease